MIPGEYVLSSAPLVINAGREAVDVAVTNTGDRPVQVGSHYHFAEANSALQFDRAAAYGRRLDIPAGTITVDGVSSDVSDFEFWNFVSYRPLLVDGSDAGESVRATGWGGTTVAPILLVLGYCVLVPIAILK